MAYQHSQEHNTRNRSYIHAQSLFCIHLLFFEWFCTLVHHPLFVPFLYFFLYVLIWFHSWTVESNGLSSAHKTSFSSFMLLHHEAWFCCFSREMVPGFIDHDLCICQLSLLKFVNWQTLLLYALFPVLCWRVHGHLFPLVLDMDKLWRLLSLINVL